MSIAVADLAGISLYLIEMAITTVEDHLNRNVPSVRDVGDACSSKVDWEAVGTLSVDLEVGYGQGEVLETGGVGQGRQLNTD